MRLVAPLGMILVGVAECGPAEVPAPPPTTPVEVPTPAPPAASAPAPSSPNAVEKPPEAHEERHDSSPFSPAQGSDEKAEMSPVVIAKGGVLRRAITPDEMFGDHQIALLDVPPRLEFCDRMVSKPHEIIDLMIGSPTEPTTTTSLQIENGTRIGPRCAKHVLRVRPKKKGALGSLELDDGPTTNVHGGIVPILACD